MVSIYVFAYYCVCERSSCFITPRGRQWNKTLKSWYSPSFSQPMCFLQDLCSELGVDDVENLVPEIREISRRLEQAGRYQEVS